MRPHAFLLLLCSLAVADAGTTPCDISYIQGVDPSEVTFKANKKLACNNNKLIQFSDAGKVIIVERLFCVTGKGWQFNRDRTVVFTKIKDTDSIAVSCVARKDCDEMLITFDDRVKRENNKLTCNNPNEKLKIIVSSPYWYSDLTCTPGSVGWTTSGSSTQIMEADYDFRVKCAIEKCKSSYIQMPADEYTTRRSGPGESLFIDCKDKEKRLEYNNQLFSIGELICDDDIGWIRDSGPGIVTLLNPPVKSDEKLNIKCVYVCHKSLITGFDADKMELNNQFSETVCKSDEEWLMYIENGQKKIRSALRCDNNRVLLWTSRVTKSNGPMDTQIITTIKSSDDITISCIPEVCLELWAADDSVKRDNNKLSCTNADEELKIDNDPTKYNDLTCTKDVGWTTGESQTQIKKDTDEFDVKCVRKPCHELLTTLGEGVKRKNNMLICTNSDEELQIDNDQTLYSNLTCTKDIGWTTNESQTKIKQDIDKFSVKCVRKPSTDAQNGGNTAVIASVSAVSALLLIAGIIAVVVFIRKRRNAPEIKQEPTKETAKSKDAPSSGAPSPSSGVPSPTASPTPSGGVPSSN